MEVFMCPKCFSERIVVVKQIRKANGKVTVIKFACSECGKRWSERVTGQC